MSWWWSGCGQRKNAASETVGVTGKADSSYYNSTGGNGGKIAGEHSGPKVRPF